MGSRRAAPQDPSRSVAVKMVNRRSLSPEFQDRVMREASIMRNLDHENIVKLYDFYVRSLVRSPYAPRRPPMRPAPRAARHGGRHPVPGLGTV